MSPPEPTACVHTIVTIRGPFPQTIAQAVSTVLGVARSGGLTAGLPVRAAPPDAEPPTRPSYLAAADRQLALYGWPQASAYRVYSAGDSGSGREEILFVARDGRACTARLGMAMAAGKRAEIAPSAPVAWRRPFEPVG